MGTMADDKALRLAIHRIMTEVVDKQFGGASSRWAVAADVSDTTVSRFLNKPLDASLPGTRTLAKLEKAAGRSLFPNLTGPLLPETHTPNVAIESPQPPPSFPRKDDMPRDVPVEGTAAGNVTGAFQFEGGPVDYVRRPPGIAGAKDVYALYVVGESMHPRFDEGELIYVHPGRTVRPGHYVVVVQKVADHEPPQAYVKRLVRRDDKTLVLEQLNPKKTLKLPANTVQSVHRILTMNDLHGV